MVTGATTNFTGSSATGFTLTDLMNWDEQLPPRFQPNASAMFTKTMANRIRAIDAGVVGGAGSSVWIQNLTIGPAIRQPGPLQRRFPRLPGLPEHGHVVRVHTGSSPD